MRTRLFDIRPATPNIGNDLIALATHALLEQVWPEPLDVVTLPARGGTGPKGSGLDVVNVYEANQLADGVLVGGGNLFENGGLTVDRGALEALAVPLLVLGVSSGRMYGRTGLVRRTDALPDADILAVCRRAAGVLVRDHATAAALEAIGVPGVVVAGCPTLFLDRFLPPPVPEPSLARAALVSVRNPRLMSVPYAERGRVAGDIRRIAAGLRDAGYSPVALLCHDYRDLAFAAELPELPSLYTEAPCRLLRWLGSCALHVGYRLHGFLARVAHGQPSIHISYDERGQAMLDGIGLADWDVPMLSCPDVTEAVLARHDELGRYAQLRAAAVPRLERWWDTTMSSVARFAALARALRAERTPAKRS